MSGTRSSVRWVVVLAVGLALGLLGGGCASRGPGGLASPAQARVQAEVARRAEVATPGPGGPAAAGAGADVSALLAAPLTEAAAVKVALLQNPAVRASYERLGIAQADLLQAGLLSNPVFSFEATFYGGAPALDLGLTRSFLDLFLRPLRRSVAAADLRAEEAAVARDLVRLVYDVRRAFVAVHAADAVLALQEDGLRRARASRDLMQGLHAAGNALDTVRTLEEAAAARAELDVEAARLRAGEAREPLRVLLGLRAEAPEVRLAGALDGPPPASPADDPVARAQAQSLDLRESAARLDAALARAGLAHREGGWSTLEAGVVGAREPEGGPFGLGPSATVTLPLLDQGQARRCASHAALRLAHARHEQLGVEVQSAARRLSRRRAALEARLQHLREVYLPLRERLVREGLQHFNAMQIGAFDVLRAKQLELDARREHAETLRETWLASLDLAELLAGSLHRERVEALHLPDAAETPEAPKGH